MISPRIFLAGAIISAVLAVPSEPRAEAKTVRHRASRTHESAVTRSESRVRKSVQTRTAAATPVTVTPQAAGSPVVSAKSPEAKPAVVEKSATGATIAPPSALALERLSQGPSMYETGRIADAAVAPAKIRQTVGRPAPRELRVERKAHTVERAPAYPGAMKDEILDRELVPRFMLLRNCRTDVARARRVAPTAVTASRLTLRWTIDPSGTVSDTLVVATAAADGKVMDCVKRQMSQWRFSFPDGGAVRVERPFRF